MSSFVNPGKPKIHQGAVQLETVVSAVSRRFAQFRGAKGLIAMLLTGALSALVVVADQIVSTWTDDHLLMAWVALWVMVFTAVALFAEASRGWTSRMAAALQRRARAASERAADERFWEVAQSDPRLMAELQAARYRAEQAALAADQPMPYWPSH